MTIFPVRVRRLSIWGFIDPLARMLEEGPASAGLGGAGSGDLARAGSRRCSLDPHPRPDANMLPAGSEMSGSIVSRPPNGILRALVGT
jgi:hypothetical protein